MLTIRHLFWNGSEEIFQSMFRVTSEPADQIVGGERYIGFEYADGRTDRFELQQTAYVMNDAGKTVATYHGSRLPPPETN